MQPVLSGKHVKLSPRFTAKLKGVLPRRQLGLQSRERKKKEIKFPLSRETAVWVSAIIWSSGLRQIC